jgi:hypothetical protein
MDYL